VTCCSCKLLHRSSCSSIRQLHPLHTPLGPVHAVVTTTDTHRLQGHCFSPAAAPQHATAASRQPQQLHPAGRSNPCSLADQQAAPTYDLLQLWQPYTSMRGAAAAAADGCSTQPSQHQHRATGESVIAWAATSSGTHMGSVPCIHTAQCSCTHVTDWHLRPRQSAASACWIAALVGS
jgi:hypothetical protein